MPSQSREHPLINTLQFLFLTASFQEITLSLDWSRVLEILGWFACALAAFFCLPALVYFPRRSLKAFALNLPDPTVWPRISVIVAAKDEEPNVPAALSGLLASDYPNLEVVFVNDRSRDRTGAVAEEFAKSDSRLTVVHIESLPDGWLGKCHAMHHAAERATGEFLLFTDGDVLFEPDSLRLSVRYTLARNLDHFCLLPSMITNSYLERTIVALFGMMFLFGTQPWFQKLRLPQSYYGVGAFNLVRRTAYDCVGGHVPIRLDVLDDVKLGKLLYKHGYRAEFLLGDSKLRVRWQDSAWGVIRGLEKNAFAGLNYSLLELLRFNVLFLLVFFLPWCGFVLWPQPAAWGWLVTLAVMHVTFGRLAVAFGAGLRVLPAQILGAAAVLFAFWRSAFITLKQGGVAWRDTLYPLSELRQNIYR